MLGKTVAKASRGSATGAAGSVAALLVLLFGVSLSLGWIPARPARWRSCWPWRGPGSLQRWIFVAPSLGRRGGRGGVSAVEVLRSQFLLLGDRKLQHFIPVRALLLGVGAGPSAPSAADDEQRRQRGRRRGRIGPSWASSFAAVSSAYVWGRMSDASSQGARGGRRCWLPGASRSRWDCRVCRRRARRRVVQAVIFFLLMVSHQGCAQRLMHIVDMADQRSQTDFTALSNSPSGSLLASAVSACWPRP